MLESSLDKCIHSVLCSLWLCQMVPIVILQSYPQRMCLINLGLFSLYASMFIYRCSSFILTHPRFFPMTITLVPGSVWCLFSSNFFHFVCTARNTKTPDLTFESQSFFRTPDCIHSQGASHGCISAQNMDHGGKVTASSPLSTDM